MQIFLICDTGRKRLAHYTWLSHKQGIAVSCEQKSQKILFWIVSDIITLESAVTANYFNCRGSTQPQDFEVNPHK